MPHLPPALAALELRIPLVQAPMAGGPTTAELVAAVCEAGALGSLAAPLLAPEQIGAAAAAIRARTRRPFAINLFVLPPLRAADCANLEPVLAALAPWFERFGLAAAVPARWSPDPAAQLDAVIDARPAVASFTFGLLEPAAVDRLHAAGVAVVGTATTAAEARAWAAVGADAVCAQGAEAGGHRGSFLHPFDDAMIGTLALVPEVVEAVSIPVIAAGGIMDGRGIAAVRALGAWAAQLGTAFLFCPEARLPPAYLSALRVAHAPDTRLTRAFSGRPARGIANPMMAAIEHAGVPLPPYPILNALTAPIRAAAAAAGDATAMSLWAGQGVGRGRLLPAAELVATLAREFAAATG